MKYVLVLFLILCTMSAAHAAPAHVTKQAHNAALVKAITYGNLVQIRKMVEQGADVNSQSSGHYVLEWAALHGNYDIVNLLLDLGANVNCTSYDGDPLVMAASQGHIDVCRLLLGRGASPNGHPNSLPPLQVTLLEALGHESGMQIVRLLITRGADVNYKFKGGETALMVAAGSGSVEATKLLWDWRRFRVRQKKSNFCFRVEQIPTRDALNILPRLQWRLW